MPGGQQQSHTGDTGTTPMEQPQTDWQSRASKANPTYASGEDTTPMQEPQTYWQARADATTFETNPVYASGEDTTPVQARADADACDPNHIHASGEDTTPMQERQTDWQARADAAACEANPVHASGEGTTAMQEPQTDWQARADSAAREPNHIYASGEGSTSAPMQQPQTDWQSIADAAASIPNALYVSRADRTYAREASGRRAGCSYIRSHLTYMAAGIVVLLSLVAVGFAPLTVMNKEEITQLSTTVDALKRDQDDMSTTVDALKRDQDDMRQLSTTVDALKRDQDDMRQLTTTLDALKLDLEKERSRTVALEQRLHDMIYCPKGYTKFRGICYKAFDTPKSFSDAAAACGGDGGTLAMPRDAGTNDFLFSLHNAVSDTGTFWFGLQDQREEGSFEWVDGSALGTYHSWGPGEPNNSGGEEDCISYVVGWKGKWNDNTCDLLLYYICQVVPGRVFFAVQNLTSRTMPGGQQQSQTGDTGTTPVQQPQTYWWSIADAAASIPNALYVSRADRTYPGGASGRCALCSFIRSKLIYIATVIAVLLSLVAVGLALLAFINNGRHRGLVRDTLALAGRCLLSVVAERDWGSSTCDLFTFWLPYRGLEPALTGLKPLYNTASLSPTTLWLRVEKSALKTTSPRL
uniref:C-type lectin domain-containing protein n=1 Tax=Branchiostoma floridae TaxID=7739 RepID=C3ZR66_BRAFL|eukprot:XP_002588928.1 hypothetical protein BRAFLDRAFT_89117 [Branchiostoma floridae]